MPRTALAARLILGDIVDAPDLEAYSRSGYRQFALWSVLFGLLLLQATPLGSAFNRSETAQWLTSLVVGLFGTKDIPASVPAVAVFAVFLLSGYFIAPLRRTLGAWFADVLLWLLDGGLRVGEWCIEHRRESAALIFVLLSVVAAGWVLVVRREQARTVARLEASHWIDDAGLFLSRSGFSTADVVAARELAGRLGDGEELRAVFGGRGLVMDVRRALARTFEAGAIANQVVLATLQAGLESDIESDPLDSRSYPEEWKAKELAHLLIARIALRRIALCDLACSEADFGIAIENFAHLRETKFASEFHNGMGRIYAGEFARVVAQDSGVSTHCNTASQCARQSLEAYTLAAEGSARCDFRDRRRANNKATFLVRLRIAQRAGPKKTIAQDDWIGREAHVSDSLKAVLEHFIECPWNERSAALLLVTASEGYASLWNGRRPSGYGQRSAEYMRAAISIQGGIPQPIILRAYCDVIANPASGFKSELRRVVPPLRAAEADTILLRIAAACP